MHVHFHVCVLQQNQTVDPEPFSSQESSIILEQKAPVFTQQYASQAQMAQGNYPPMQDPNFHPMAQRPGYAALRMQPRPSLRPAGIVQNQPNQLRLQLQHRLQAQQVFHNVMISVVAILGYNHQKSTVCGIRPQCILLLYGSLCPVPDTAFLFILTSSKEPSCQDSQPSCTG